jgi:flavorubredoxin
MITNAATGTRIDEIASGIYRISTPITHVPGGFSYNRYLVLDEAPLFYHTGPRGLFEDTSEAIATVLPVARLRYVAFSHYESDESGALNQLLAIAPQAVPLCGRLNAMLNADAFDRPARVLVDGEDLSLGARAVRWLDAPHVPHAWECGHLFESTTGTLFCGDLLTQPGRGETPLTENDILGPSERLRKSVDYYAHAPDTRAIIERIAEVRPTTLACMHGSAWRGDGRALLRALAEQLGDRPDKRDDRRGP